MSSESVELGEADVRNVRSRDKVMHTVAVSVLLTLLVIIGSVTMVALVVSSGHVPGSPLCSDNSSRMFASLVAHYAVAVKLNRMPVFSISTRDSREGIMALTPERMRVELCSLIALGPVVVDITVLSSYDIPQVAVVMFYGERTYCADDLDIVCPPSKGEVLSATELKRLHIEFSPEKSSE